jgi:hypothetical protein
MLKSKRREILRRIRQKSKPKRRKRKPKKKVLPRKKVPLVKKPQPPPEIKGLSGGKHARILQGEICWLCGLTFVYGERYTRQISPNWETEKIDDVYSHAGCISSITWESASFYQTVTADTVYPLIDWWKSGGEIKSEWIEWYKQRILESTSPLC